MDPSLLSDMHHAMRNNAGVGALRSRSQGISKISGAKFRSRVLVLALARALTLPNDRHDTTRSRHVRETKERDDPESAGNFDRGQTAGFVYPSMSQLEPFKSCHYTEKSESPKSVPSGAPKLWPPRWSATSRRRQDAQEVRHWTLGALSAGHSERGDLNWRCTVLYLSQLRRFAEFRRLSLSLPFCALRQRGTGIVRSGGRTASMCHETSETNRRGSSITRNANQVVVA
ncbi:hypothetical protein F4803DRAFT_125275 [Xylaria telfairii]|nr:hypothetical protein F4803DRAFT_125275 [Xylaria telfairii]